MIPKGDFDNQKLEQLASKVKSAKTKTKKGKRFADATFMLSLVDQVNKKQEEKIQNLLEHETELLKRIVKKGQNRSRKKDAKRNKIAEVKERLRNKKNVANDRGDRHKIDSTASKDARLKKKVQFKQ